jgi:hypothetical protein
MWVLTELRQRGVRDIVICCVDGLKGFPQGDEAVLPEAVVQTCIMHLIRTSLTYVPRWQYDQVVKHVKPIYTAINSDAAEQALEAFDQNWGAQLPVITQAWRDSWGARHPVPGLRTRDLPGDRHHGIEALNRQLRRQSNQGALPDRGRSPQTALPRDPTRVPAVDPNPWPDEGTARVQDPIRRPPTRLTACTVSWTPSLRAACLH